MLRRLQTKNLDYFLIFLEILDEHYERTKSTIIRRAHLLVLVEARIEQKTGGKQYEIGRGTFETIIRLFETQKLIKGSRDKNHKQTDFLLNVPKIKNKLDEERYYALFGGSRPIQSEKEIGSTLLQEITSEEISARLDSHIRASLGYRVLDIMINHAKATLLARDAVIEAMRVIVPRLLNLP